MKQTKPILLQTEPSSGFGVDINFKELLDFGLSAQDYLMIGSIILIFVAMNVLGGDGSGDCSGGWSRSW
jgi:hypothetical protein